MAWVVRDLKAHIIPTPSCGQDFHPSYQAAQDPIQFGLEPRVGHPQKEVYVQCSSREKSQVNSNHCFYVSASFTRV